MTFDDMINDIEKMVGLELESIKKGANLTLTGVDRESKRVGLITTKGQKKTRPFSEFKKIWDKLCTSPAAHVDSVFNGSGSSRNQPETIMANIPYIEWFFLDGKKHLVLMNEPTHNYGTLLKMDDISALEVKDKLHNINTVACEVIVITDDIRSSAISYEKVTGLPLNPVSPGIYEQYKDNIKHILITTNILNGQISPGTYIVIKGNIAPKSGNSITINGIKYVLLQSSGLNLMVKSE